MSGRSTRRGGSRRRGAPWAPRALGVAGLAALIALLVLALVSGGGSQRARVIAGARSAAPATPPAGGHLAIGLTEANADLLWSPASGQDVPAAFSRARGLLSALHPAFVRLVVNWAALAPTPTSAVQAAAPVDGCARGVAPCGVYGGLRSRLLAIASQQRSGAPAQVVVDIAGVPPWAATAPSGCERPGTTAFSRPLRPGALASYRSLVRALLGLGRTLHIPLPWWTPWNEPNHPGFVSPQRAACDTSSPSLSPALYAELERAMGAELTADGGGHRLLLGELSGLTLSSPLTTSIAEFVHDLPADVMCASDVWSVHDYPGQRAVGPSPVHELESALDARGACGLRAHIWVTETGAGAPHAGDPRPAGRGSLLSGCRDMAAMLAGWQRDPRVQAVFQYEFRDDTRFPVGLIDARLRRVFPAYGLWLAWSAARAPGAPLPSRRACI